MFNDVSIRPVKLDFFPLARFACGRAVIIHYLNARQGNKLNVVADLSTQAYCKCRDRSLDKTRQLGQANYRFIVVVIVAVTFPLLMAVAPQICRAYINLNPSQSSMQGGLRECHGNLLCRRHRSTSLTAGSWSRS